MILPIVGLPIWRVASGYDPPVLKYLQAAAVAPYPLLESVIYRTQMCKSEAPIPYS